jgi:hypothetical protein
LEKTSSEGSYINSILDIYFRICVQFNQLFITISYFWRYKYLNYMHETKMWAFRCLFSALVTMETFYNRMCAKPIRLSRSWAFQPSFSCISFYGGKKRNPRRSLNTQEEKSLLPAFLHAFDFVKWPFLESKMNGLQNS